jgi:hypothetical protein
LKRAAGERVFFTCGPTNGMVSYALAGGNLLKIF